MPLRSIGQNVFERAPLDPGSTDYVAKPEFVEYLQRWYDSTYPYEQEERPGINIEHPDGFKTVERAEHDGRTVLTLWHISTDACVEVSFRQDGGEKKDFEVRAVPPEAAYARALDADEKSRAYGTTIYNERHPKP
jgi:hypothetical protein